MFSLKNIVCVILGHHHVYGLIKYSGGVRYYSRYCLRCKKWQYCNYENGDYLKDIWNKDMTNKVGRPRKQFNQG